MKIIRPIPITDAKFTSSTVPEDDYAEWSSGTAYTVGQRVIRTTTHRIYECLVSNTNNIPENNLTGLTPKWLKIAPTNRWALFDEEIGTVTTASDSMTIVLTPGRFNSIALLEVSATTIDISLSVSGEEIYNKSLDTSSGNAIGDWYSFFYEPVYEQDGYVATNLVDSALLELPAYSEGILTVTLTRTGGTVSCGALIVGLYAYIGGTTYGASVGIVDYSRKTIDAFGNASIVKRKYSKRFSSNVDVETNNVDAVARILAQYRSTPLVWVGVDSGYTSMLVYGFYNDWDLTVDNPAISKLSIKIEGLV